MRENNHPVMMSHCPTRSHCANPSGVLHSASLRYGDSAQCHAAARLAPVEYATVAQLAALPAPAPLAHPPGAGIPAIVAPLRARETKSHHDGAARLGG